MNPSLFEHADDFATWPDLLPARWAAAVRGTTATLVSPLAPEVAAAQIVALDKTVHGYRKFYVRRRNEDVAVATLGNSGRAFSPGWTIVARVRSRPDGTTVVHLREAVPLAWLLAVAALMGLLVLISSLMVLKLLTAGRASVGDSVLVLWAIAAVVWPLLLGMKSAEFVRHTAASPLPQVRHVVGADASDTV